MLIISQLFEVSLHRCHYYAELEKPHDAMCEKKSFLKKLQGTCAAKRRCHSAEEECFLRGRPVYSPETSLGGGLQSSFGIESVDFML